MKAGTKTAKNEASDVDEKDTIMYKGRRISRDERLRQMRESQKNLRNRRNQEIEDLKLENQRLKQVIKDLENSRKIVSDTNSTQGFLQNELMESILENDIPEHFQFLLKYGPERASEIFVSSHHCFFQLFADKTLEFVGKSYHEGYPLITNDGLFQISPVFNENETFFKNYIGELIEFQRKKEFPKKWLKGEKCLSKGVLSPIGILRYLLEYVDLKTVNTDILISCIVTRAFASEYGPAIKVHMLSQCVEDSINVEFDHFFLTDEIN